MRLHDASQEAGITALAMSASDDKPRNPDGTFAPMPNVVDILAESGFKFPDKPDLTVVEGTASTLDPNHRSINRPKLTVIMGGKAA